MPEQVRADLALLEVGDEIPSTRRASSLAKLAWQPAEILAVAHQDIEGVN